MVNPNALQEVMNRVSIDYASMNRLTETLLPDSRVSTNAYDALGRMIARTGAGSVPAFYGFDPAGRMTNLADGVRPVEAPGSGL